MKKYKFCLSLFSLLLMNLLYFLWQPYPKSIIKTTGTPWTYSDIVTSILYFVLLAMVINVSVRSLARPAESVTIFDWGKIKYIAALVAVQLCLDLARIVVIRLLGEYAAIVCDVFTVIGWGLFTILLSSMIEHEKRCKSWAYTAGGVVVVLLLCILLDLRDVFQRRELIEKYYNASKILESKMVNGQFRFEIRNMLLDFFGGATFLLYFMKTSKEASHKKREQHGEVGRLVFRVIILLDAIAAVYFVKVLLLPNNAIFPGYFEHSGYNTLYQEPRPEYDITDADIFSIYRASGRGEKNLIYCVSRDTVWYNGTNLFDFRTEGRYLGSEGGKPKDKIEYNAWQTIPISDAETAVFASQEIVWVSENETVHISFKELSTAEENAILTALCSERIAAGDWRFFEYGYEYLLKYRADFIIPYMERYAAGEFTDKEIKYSGDYNPEYIQKLAVAALNNSDD